MRPLLFLLIGMSTLWSCKGDQPEIRFRMPIQPIEVTFEAGISTFDSHYYTFQNVPTRFDSLAASFGVSTADIQAVRPRTARILSVFGNVDYDFIRDISVRICSQNEADRLQAGEAVECAREIFWRNPVPEQLGSTLDLIANENDVKSLLEQPRAAYQIKLVSPLRYSTTQFIESRFLMEFNVE